MPMLLPEVALVGILASYLLNVNGPCSQFTIIYIIWFYLNSMFSLSLQHLVFKNRHIRTNTHNKPGGGA